MYKEALNSKTISKNTKMSPANLPAHEKMVTKWLAMKISKRAALLR